MSTQDNGYQTIGTAKQIIRDLLSGGTPNGHGDAAGKWQPLVYELYDDHKQGGTEAVRAKVNTLIKTDSELMRLISEELPAPKPSNESLNCCPLPDAAQLDESLCEGSSPWLDEYISFSGKWSPRAYDGFHEAVGLWILSTVAARRVSLPHGGRRYTPLFIALTARTSLYSKSTTADIGINVLSAAGLDWLLAPDESTPQKFVQSMAGKLPSDYGSVSSEQQDFIKRQLAFSGQRGWFYEEFGQHLAAMSRENGTMADFKGILRRLDDCKEKFERATISRGTETITNPYIALLAGLTPADIKPYAKSGGAMWHDGFWARFAFVSPPDDEAKLDRFPRGNRIIPSTLITPLRYWHDRLGTPDLNVTLESEDTYQWARGPLPERPCSWDDDAYEAYYTYDVSLKRLLQKPQYKNNDFDGNYTRFPEKALRIAMLLASLENGGHLEIRHWARAQYIAERWRSSLHNLYDQLNQAETTEAEQIEEKILQVVRRFKEVSPSVVNQYVHGLDTTNARYKLIELVKAGVLEEVPNKKSPKYRFPIEEDFH
jgi:hypothetical protein